MKKKILLVGGAGFIGHNLAVKLKKKNYDILIVDNLKVNNFDFVIFEQGEVHGIGFLLANKI